MEKAFILRRQAKILSIREENEGLREQLKGLCDYLSKELERKKLKKTQKTAEIDDPNSKNIAKNSFFKILSRTETFSRAKCQKQRKTAEIL